METLSPWDGREILDGEIQTEQHELHIEKGLSETIIQRRGGNKKNRDDDDNLR